MAGTVLTYGDVTIEHCFTKVCRQEVEYDESGTDPIGTKVTIRVMGTITLSGSGTSVGQVGLSGGGSSGNGAGSVMAQVRAALSEVRKPLHFYILNSANTSSTIIQVSGVAGRAGESLDQKDVNNGPKPRVVDVQRIVGSNSLWVEFEVETTVVECRGGGNVSGGVISNRWSAGDDIDENQYTTRTIRGRLRVSSVEANPQAYRSLFMPPLQDTFVRQSINTVTSMDGLTVDYTIVDREVYATPPYPLSKFSGTYTVSTGINGVTMHAEVSVRGEGPRDLDKRSVITRTLQIAYARINLNNAANRFILESASIIEYLAENVAECRIRIQFLDKEAISGLNLAKSTLGTPLNIVGYEPGRARIPRAYGSATPTGLFVSYLQKPCSTEHGIQQVRFESTEGTSTTVDRDSQEINVVTEEGTLAAEVPAYSDSHEAAMYVHYTVDSFYPVKMNRVQCPIAKAQTATGATAVIIPVSKAIAGRHVIVTAERVGAWPEFPTPSDTYDEIGGVKAYLMDFDIDPSAPETTADNRQQLFRMKGTYRYAFDRPIPDGQPLNAGSLPWDTSTITGNAVPSVALSQNGFGAADGIA